MGIPDALVEHEFESAIYNVEYNGIVFGLTRSCVLEIAGDTNLVKLNDEQLADANTYTLAEYVVGTFLESMIEQPREIN